MGGRTPHIQSSRKTCNETREEKGEEEKEKNLNRQTDGPTHLGETSKLRALLKVSLSLFSLSSPCCLFYFSSPYYGPVVTLLGSVSINSPSRIV